MQRRAGRCTALGVALAAAALGAVSACEGPHHQAPPTTESRIPDTPTAHPELPFQPIPRQLDLPKDKVALGRRLFDDPLVSGSGDRSCADCHDLAAGGVAPGEQRSNHPMSPDGPYNVPTVFNVGFNFRYNWQGKFETLEEHLGGPMMSEKVMAAGSWEALLARLRPVYDADFRAAGYDEGVSEQSVRSAMALFQRSLITPDARFDRYLRGELELSSAEQRGLGLFLDLGCASCHQGMNLGGNLYQRFGVMESAFDRPTVELDYGRQLVTGDARDAHVFRVPSLRNVAVTAPYFHDGSAPELADAVRKMARVQLGDALTEAEIRDIVTFLHTLTGVWEGRPLDAEVAP